MLPSGQSGKAWAARAGSSDEGKFARFVEADAALKPAILPALELPDGQGVEEFIGDQQQRTRRQLVHGLMPGGAFSGELLFLDRAQARASARPDAA